MKLLTIGATLAALATAAPLSAQGRNANQGIPPGQMPPAGMCRVWIDGVPPGRQPRPTDCATARLNVPVNGRVIYGGNRRNQDCTYSRSTNSVGDVIFGRSGSNVNNCVDNTNSRVNGAWYPVGTDRNGGTIYERRTRDSNGRLIVQRARRDRNGNLSILNTRNRGTFDNRTSNDRRVEDGRFNNRDDGDDDDDQGEGRSDGRGHGNGHGHGKGKGHDRD